MTASSATGRGNGDSNKPTLTDLARWANGPIIMAAGRVVVAPLDEEEPPTSPPSSGYTDVNLPYPLPGVADDYSIFLTPSDGASQAWIVNIVDNDDLNMTGFTIAADTDGDVMYMVVRNGFRPI